MFSSTSKRSPQIDEANTVQREFFRSRSTGDGQPDDDREIVAPEEVFVPDMLPWVKERSHAPGDGIDGFDCRVFPVIASLTRER